MSYDGDAVYERIFDIRSSSPLSEGTIHGSTISPIVFQRHLETEYQAPYAIHRGNFSFRSDQCTIRIALQHNWRPDAEIDRPSTRSQFRYEARQRLQDTSSHMRISSMQSPTSSSFRRYAQSIDSASPNRQGSSVPAPIIGSILDVARLQRHIPDLTPINDASPVARIKSSANPQAAQRDTDDDSASDDDWMPALIPRQDPSVLRHDEQQHEMNSDTHRGTRSSVTSQELLRQYVAGVDSQSTSSSDESV